MIRSQLLWGFCRRPAARGCRHALAARSSSSPTTPVEEAPTNVGHLIGLPPAFLIFGCNTDIGKTVLTAGLIRSAAATSTSTSSSPSPGGRSTTHYIKPLQCGGSDEAFVRKHCNHFVLEGQQQQEDTDYLTTATTLFRWETPASPHLAARIENKPISDQQVLEKLTHHLQSLSVQDDETNNKNSSNQSIPIGGDDDDIHNSRSRSSIWIETAGGVLSPAASSPLNTSIQHASPSSSSLSSSLNHQHNHWGWMPQADLYLPLVSSFPSTTKSKRNKIQVVLIGDGRLGGISATLSSLESLISRRHYTIAGIVQICGSGESHHDTNQEALQEYAWSMSKRLKQQKQQHHQHEIEGNNDDLDPLWIDPDSSIVSLPALPPEPEPLMEWYNSDAVKHTLDKFVHRHLFRYNY